MKKSGKENIFKRLKFFLSNKETRVFVFFLSILILSWPFMAFTPDRSAYFHFIYFFSAWTVLIFFLFVSHLGRGKDKDQNL